MLEHIHRDVHSHTSVFSQPSTQPIRVCQRQNGCIITTLFHHLLEKNGHRSGFVPWMCNIWRVPIVKYGMKIEGIYSIIWDSRLQQVIR